MVELHHQGRAGYSPHPAALDFEQPEVSHISPVHGFVGPVLHINVRFLRTASLGVLTMGIPVSIVSLVLVYGFVGVFVNAVAPGDKERWLIRHKRGVDYFDPDDPYFGHPFDVVAAIRSGLDALQRELGVMWASYVQMSEPGGHKKRILREIYESEFNESTVRNLKIRLTFLHGSTTYLLARQEVNLSREWDQIPHIVRRASLGPYGRDDSYTTTEYRYEPGGLLAARYRKLDRQHKGLLARKEFFNESVELALDGLVVPTIEWAKETLGRVGSKNTLGEVVKLHADEDSVRLAIPECAKALLPIAESLRRSAQPPVVDETAQKMDDDLARELEDLDAEFALKSVQASARIGLAVKALAPGAASEPLTEDTDAGITAAPSSYVRFGTIDSSTPAIAPFLNRAGWFISGDSTTRAELISQVLLRTILQVPTEALKIRSFDPMFSGVLGLLAPLGGVSATTYAEPQHDSDALRQLLGEVTSEVSAVSTVLGGRGMSSVIELWEADGSPSWPLTLLVVLSYPSGIDVGLQDTLVRLAQSGPSRGMMLVVDHDTEITPPRGVDPADLMRHMVTFKATEHGWQCSRLPDQILAAYDEALPWPARQALVQLVVRRAGPQGPKLVRLQELVAGLTANPWSDQSVDAVEAIIGTHADGRATAATLALRSENPPQSNLLLGGAVGQGKSNLLLAMIYALALRYSPDELEMLLIDFKHGLEFQRLGPDENGRNWLPHASVVCLESDKVLGLEILKHVRDELTARADLFLRARVNSFTSYRKSTGQTLPRLLLVIDEFQVLFDGNDDVTAEAVSLVEKLARQGRAYGIHLILSSQTLSGISALAVKAESIFAQFATRLSFKNTAEESQTILGRGNAAASDLTRPGEVVINRDYGRPSANETVLTGLVEPDFADEVQRQLWALDVRRREPVVFLGQNFAPWPIQHDGFVADTAYLGRPLSVGGGLAGFDFRSDTSQAVGVIGTGQAEATAVLVAMIATLTAKWSPGDAVVVLDGRSPQSRGDAVLAECLQQARARDLTVNVRTDADITDYLVSIVGSPPPQCATLVVALHLQRIDSLSDTKPFDPENPYGEMVSGAGALRELVGRGSISGTHVIGWWPNVAAMQEALGYDSAGMRRFVLARAAQEDVRQVAGLSAPKSVASPRVMVVDPDRDDGTGSGVTTVIPFDPWDPHRA